MSILVLSENSNNELKSSTLNTISAASKICEDVHVLIIVNKCEKIVETVAKIKKVKKILHLDNEIYENPIAENIAPVIVNLAENYKHILAPASTFGKNIMPRVSALLDLSQISDVINIISEDTFIRPIYAGNAFATVQSTEDKKIITISPTSFESALIEDGNAEVEKISFNNIV